MIVTKMRKNIDYDHERFQLLILEKLFGIMKMLKLNHKNLEVWKRSIKLISEIYSITDNFPKKEMFGLSNQMRRASISVASNIAEVASRKSCM